MFKSSFFSFVLLSSLVAPSVLAASADDWRGRSIYQVVTDRFARDDNQTPACNTTDRKYCGGTWKGITNRLDYIQNMGFDSVWISPIVGNVEGTTAYGEAYHGYWTSNINTLNSHFGTADDLKALSAALHSRKMYLMVDIVVNHFVALNSTSPTGTAETPASNLDFSTITPFNTVSSYHPFCFINDYNNQTDVEQCWLGDVNLPLADLNTEDTETVNTMNSWINKLVKDYDIDGLRIDTVKHVRKDFWPGFKQAAGVFATGEVLLGDPEYVAGYTKVIDSVLDYPNWYQLIEAFGTTSGNLSALTSMATQAQKAYGDSAFVAGSFLENHDQPRFQATTTDMALVKNAMAWPFVHDGIPIMYYGQEQGLTGKGDPDNREALWPSGYDTSKPLVAHVKSLNGARKAAVAANSAFLTTPAQFIPQTQISTFAFTKGPLAALFTNTGSSSSDKVTWTIPASTKLFKANEKAVDVLTCTSVDADGDGKVTVTAEGGNPKIMLPASAVTSVCPTVRAQGSSPSASNSAITILGGMEMRWIVVFGALLVGSTIF
ncbi:glycoside hydrolase family 13 protein [Crucibulum laeve]|uniref:alpha-amylase n=1 Tax=Crucibulum laeve TaxID=68775 RepID=A0A5C3M064_9AGAR|nr:glycoside hydrolase family 13 protein [Crucibulum laeve]